MMMPLTAMEGKAQAAAALRAIDVRSTVKTAARVFQVMQITALGEEQYRNYLADVVPLCIQAIHSSLHMTSSSSSCATPHTRQPAPPSTPESRSTCVDVCDCDAH